MPTKSPSRKQRAGTGSSAGSQPVDPTVLSIINQMPVLVWTTDRQLRSRFVMGGAERFAGVHNRNVVGRTLRQILDPDESAVVLAGHRQALRGLAASYRSEFRGRVFESTVEPLRGKRGKIIGVVGAAIDITERHKAEQLSARHQRLLEAIVDKGWEGILLSNRAGEVIWCNRSVLELLGVKRGDLIGKRPEMASLIDRRDVPAALRFRKALRRAPGATFAIEVRLRPRGGALRWIEYVATNLLDDPEVGAIVGKFRDITERHEAEARATRTQRLLQAIVDEGWEGLLLNDRHGIVKYCNRATKRLLGINPKDLIGKRASSLLDPDEREKALEFRKTLRMRPGGSLTSEFRIRHPNGKLHWVEFTATNLLDNPDVESVVGKLRDITERKEAAERVARSQRMFQTIVDKGWEGLVLNDRDGVVRYCNRATERLLGVNADEIVGKSAVDFLDPRDIEKAESFRDNLRRRAGRTLTTELRVRRGDACRWIEYTATNLLDDPAVNAVVGKLRDITERKESQEAIAGLSQRLIRLQQEEERRIARELHDSTSQCLTALMLNLGAITATANLPRKLTAKLSESVGLARQVAREIRTASYLLHPPTLEDFGLIPALKEYVRGFALRSGISVNFRAPSSDPIRMNPETEMAIFRIVQESLANVHRHSGTKSADVVVTNNRKALAVQVSDHGKGIPARLLKSLGNQSSPFWNGVGLNGIRERVRQLNGRMEVKRKSPGTAIRVEIPLSEHGMNSLN